MGIVYVAALGHTFGPQEDRGIYKTTNGGKTWKKILFIDQNTGGIDIAIDRKNPNFLITSMWEIYINTWGLNSGGKSGGVFISKKCRKIMGKTRQKWTAWRQRKACRKNCCINIT